MYERETGYRETLDEACARHERECGGEMIERYVKTGMGRGHYVYTCAKNCGRSYQTDSSD